MVPPVPAPATNAPTRPLVCSRISAPVVSSWARTLAGLLKLVGEKPAVLLGHPPRDVAEVVGARRRRVGRDDTRAPSDASATRLSIDIFSGITHTRP
jgi:hypothetical protein